MVWSSLSRLVLCFVAVLQTTWHKCCRILSTGQPIVCHLWWQAHCEEVEHDDDFMYDCEEVEIVESIEDALPEARVPGLGRVLWGVIFWVVLVVWCKRACLSHG